MNQTTQTKTVRKRFDITQYEEEQAFLEDMHRQGWCFVNKAKGAFLFSAATYYFSPCQPQEMIYQIDYRPNELKNNPDYIRMFWDLGWESCWNDNATVIFRKPKLLMNGNETIYTENDERLKYVKHTISEFIMGFIISLVLATAFFIGAIIVSRKTGTVSLLGGDVVMAAISIVYAILLIHYLIRKKAIERTMNNEGDEINE